MHAHTDTYRCVHTCTHVRTRTGLHAHTCVYACAGVHAHIHVCTHPCTHTHMCTHIHTYTCIQRHRLFVLQRARPVRVQIPAQTQIPAGRAPLQLVMGTQRQGMALTQTSQVCDCQNGCTASRSCRVYCPGGMPGATPRHLVWHEMRRQCRQMGKHAQVTGQVSAA